MRAVFLVLAVILGLIGLSILAFVMVASISGIKAGRSLGGKDVLIIPLLAALGALLVKWAIDSWRKFRSTGSSRQGTKRVA